MNSSASEVGRSRAAGFTLVEMMAVLAVITILALMAVPSWLDRLVRQQIEAALPLADVAKKPIGDYRAFTGDWPEDNEALALPEAAKIVSNHVAALRVEDGAIHLVFGNRASKVLHGKTLSLRPAIVPDAPVVPIAWVCAQAEPPQKMVVQGVDRTDVPTGLLPLECRALKR